MRHYNASEAKGRMPAKRPGVHRFVVTVSFTSSPAALVRMAKGEETLLLDEENMLMVAGGCWDCEQAWPPDTETCPAGDQWEDPHA